MIIQESLFNIPCWKIQVINFEEKKKKLTKLLESYPEEPQEMIQPDIQWHLQYTL